MEVVEWLLNKVFHHHLKTFPSQKYHLYFETQKGEDLLEGSSKSLTPDFLRHSSQSVQSHQKNPALFLQFSFIGVDF